MSDKMNLQNHIFFQLQTEADIMQFLALDGMKLLDPSKKGERVNKELVDFLTHRNIMIVDLILWRRMQDA